MKTMYVWMYHATVFSDGQRVGYMSLSTMGSELLLFFLFQAAYEESYAEPSYEGYESYYSQQAAPA